MRRLLRRSSLPMRARRWPKDLAEIDARSGSDPQMGVVAASHQGQHEMAGQARTSTIRACMVLGTATLLAGCLFYTPTTSYVPLITVQRPPRDSRDVEVYLDQEAPTHPHRTVGIFEADDEGRGGGHSRMVIRFRERAAKEGLDGIIVVCGEPGSVGQRRTSCPACAGSRAPERALLNEPAVWPRLRELSVRYSGLRSHALRGQPTKVSVVNDARRVAYAPVTRAHGRAQDPFGCEESHLRPVGDGAHSSVGCGTRGSRPARTSLGSRRETGTLPALRARLPPRHREESRECVKAAARSCIARPMEHNSRPMEKFVAQ